MKNNKKLIIIICVLVVILFSLFIYIKLIKDNNIIDVNIEAGDNTNFDFKVIKETNNLVKNQNYLISPLSIGYALSLLNEGALGSTKTEIDNLLNKYKLPNIINVKNRVGIANLLFIKEDYKNDINTTYIKTLQDKYSSDVMFDAFNTPVKVNEWISEKTYNMIPNAIDDLSEDFVLGLANTIAIDVEWQSKFKCNQTSSEEFTNQDGTKMNATMMHSSEDARYIESKNAKGIIKNYVMYNTKTGESTYEKSNDTIELEYIAILPNKDINDYLKTFDEKEFKKLLDSQNELNKNIELRYALPKYTYDFKYNDFQKMLENLGMKSAFDEKNANFKKMLNQNSLLELYVGDTLHKTHIELSENGTKASAVTAFMMYKNTSIGEQKKIIEIKFNKPFIYIIKDKNSDNIWFFGTVFEPMKLEDNTTTCDYN